MKQLAGMTCCVGPVYAKYLEKTLAVWMGTGVDGNKGLDKLVIVTKPKDYDVCRVYDNFLSRYPRFIGRITLIETDVFTSYHGSFNKGAALNVAYNILNPVDWVLHFDSDILPPPDFKDSMLIQETNGYLTIGKLYGSKRFSETRNPLDETPIYPYGYFHLWNMLDPVVQYWPLFSPFYSHCGHYDAEFADRWSPSHRKDLGLDLIHYGEPRNNWFGTDKSTSNSPNDNFEMRELHRIGLRKARELKIGKVDCPDYKLKVRLNGNSQQAIHTAINILRQWSKCFTDPWTVCAYWNLDKAPMWVNTEGIIDVDCNDVMNLVRNLTTLLETKVGIRY